MWFLSLCAKACAVSTWDFLLGTAVGLTPGTVMMSWVGWSLRKYTAHSGGDGGDGGSKVRPSTIPWYFCMFSHVFDGFTSACNIFVFMMLCSHAFARRLE